MDERKVTIYGEPCSGNYRVITRVLPSGRAAGSLGLAKPARKWRTSARTQLKRLPPMPVITGPVELEIVVFLGRPGRLVWRTRPMPPEWAPKKPDATNVQKLVEDLINGVWIEDDAQVVRATITKLYAAGPGYGDPRARVEITLRALALPDGTASREPEAAQGGLFSDGQ